MRKIAIITFLFLSFFVNSTQAQEPTKQETIDWIASKMVNYGKKNYFEKRTDFSVKFCSFSNVSYATNGKIVYSTNDYTFIIRKPYAMRNRFGILIIDLSHVHSVEVMEIEGIRSLKILGSNIYNFKTYTNKEAIDKNEYLEDTYSELHLNAPKYKDDDPENFYTHTLIDFNGEPDLFNRMHKAFQTLAKLNNAQKPKEKF